MYRIGSSLRSAVSPSMVVALLALFVAVGGTAYATQRQQEVLGADIVSRVTVSPYVAPGGRGIAVSSCPRGYRAIGGGAQHLHDFKTADDWWDIAAAGPVIIGFGDEQPRPWKQSQFPWWSPSEEPTTQRLQPLTKLGHATGWGAWMRNVGSIPKRFSVVVTCAPVVVDQR